VEVVAAAAALAQAQEPPTQPPSLVVTQAVVVPVTPLGQEQCMGGRVAAAALVSLAWGAT
jgi:hypothetical protein